MLASGQEKSVLIHQIKTHLEQVELHGFFYMLLHEIVIRKELFVEDDQLNEIAKTLTKSKLSSLPLQLSSIETKLHSLTFYNSSASCSMPTPLFNGEIPINYHEKQVSKTEKVELLNAPILEKQCLIALDNWTRESNGKTEVRSGKMKDLETPAEEIIGTLFQTIFEKNTVLKIAQATPNRIFAMLYATSANGGAYSKGEICAYGRLKAWHSFLGLCGFDFEKEMIRSIDAELEHFIWYEFVSNTWFYRQLSWDLGVVCIDTRTNKIRAIIGTDTD
jgi:hypothetical protein